MNLKNALAKLPVWSTALLCMILISAPQLRAKPCSSCCREAWFKPKRCEPDRGPRLDHHATENMGPHGYNYDGIPYYLDDGYGHYGGGSWW